jgi:hypothetical protein
MPLTAVGQLGQTSPRVILNVLRVLEQDVRDEMERPLGILIGTYQHSARPSFAHTASVRLALLHSDTHLLAVTSQTVEFEVRQEEPAGWENPFWALVVLQSLISIPSPFATRHNCSGQRCRPSTRKTGPNRLTFQPFATLWSVESFELS